ncbi:predicted protein [Arabidopsis lyrata subsp. lyrata]|uniref:Predicted protein n=1 Tax=Arabidopsis lyrata subsp. lyrata TaxID=81972 RepID=D7MX74_ARALL|nr:predicted protein [Arabidopsis lyrata subsp. lyrata]
MDITGESKLMLFDSFVEQIIGTPATELLEGTNEAVINNSKKNDQPTDLKVDGVVDLDNPKEHDQPKFLHKLDEAGQEAITKVSEAEQKKVLLKKIKVEKIEGQKGAK